ncbi:MAG: GlcG/HbpS family heme-binding protein [Candidatus Rokuibacteriota bacterium]
MVLLTTDQALAIVARARETARAMGVKPLGYAVVDAGGHLLALARDEQAGFLRAAIAANKAWGCMALGISGARLEQVVKGWESWFVGIQGAATGRLVPTPGGVLVRSAAGDRLGAVGISGDSSRNDLAVATAAIEAVGLTADNAGD